eukprot:3948243-Pyramimonas_sp.AAC.1
MREAGLAVAKLEVKHARNSARRVGSQEAERANVSSGRETTERVGVVCSVVQEAGEQHDSDVPAMGKEEVNLASLEAEQASVSKPDGEQANTVTQDRPMSGERDARETKNVTRYHSTITLPHRYWILRTHHT